MIALLGILVIASAVGWLGLRYRQLPKKGVWRRWGTIGMLVLVISHVLMIAGFEPVATYFNAIIWSGYILFVDAVVFRIRGSSPIATHTKGFFLSLPAGFVVYAVFELYNLRIHAWEYRYSVSSDWARWLLFGWGWVQVWPSILETMWLANALGVVKQVSRARLRMSGPMLVLSSVFGGVLLLFPLVVPQEAIIYSAFPLGAIFYYGCIFYGILFLLDPLNRLLSRKSFVTDFEAGNFRRFLTLIFAGALCGFLWEFWNYWAAGKWIYVVPVLNTVRIFEMPVLGYSFFPPFAVECCVMFETLTVNSSLVSDLTRAVEEEDVSYSAATTRQFKASTSCFS